MRKLKLVSSILLIIIFAVSSVGCDAVTAAQSLADRISQAAQATPTPTASPEPAPSSTASSLPDLSAHDIFKYRNENSETKDASSIDDEDVWDPFSNPDQAADAAEEQRFIEYANNLVGEIPALGVIDELYLFADPEAAGVNIADPDNDTTYEEDWEEYYDSLHKIRYELKDFDMSKLSRNSAMTLQLLKDAVNSSLLDEDYYLIASNVLGLWSSFIQLPNLIAEAPFRKEGDFTDVLDLIADLPEIYEEYVDIEKERQDAGVGMTPAEIELVKEEIERIAVPGENPVEAALVDKIDEADFLSDQRKTELKEQVAEYIEKYYIPAYEYVLEELSGIEGRTGTPGLVGAEGGADYYEIILEQMGIDMDPETAQAYILDEFYYYQDISSLILMSNTDFLEAFVNEDDDQFDITDGMTAQEIVEHLAEAIKNEFKDVGNIVYTVESVPEGMEMPDVAAFYLTKPLDAGNSEPAVIYINNEETGGDFITLAHEGFPGHLYQDAYARLNARPYALELLSNYQAFTEGWGTYAQVVAASYAPAYPDYAYLLAINEFMYGLIYAYMDIGINYLGWDREQAADEMSMAFGFQMDESDELIDYMFEHLPAYPGTFVAYYLGAAKMLELRRIAEEDLGDDFSAIDFNSAILDIAPAPLSVIEAAVYNYIYTALNDEDAGTDAAVDEAA